MTDLLKFNTIVELIKIVRCIRLRIETGQEIDYNLKTTLESSVNNILSLLVGLKLKNIDNLSKYLDETIKNVEELHNENLINTQDVQDTSNLDPPPSCYDDYDDWNNESQDIEEQIVDDYEQITVPKIFTTTIPTYTTVTSVTDTTSTTSSYSTKNSKSNISKYGRKRKPVKKYGY